MILEELVKQIENITGLNARIKNIPATLYLSHKKCELLTSTGMMVLDVELMSNDGYNWYPFPSTIGTGSFHDFLWEVYCQDAPERHVIVAVTK